MLADLLDVHINKLLNIQVSAKQLSVYWLSGSFEVSLVRIVLGGGAELIDLLLDEFKQENPVRVIFVRGSGGAADVVSYAHRSVLFQYYKNLIVLSMVLDFLNKSIK